jgi:hypothetical protein
MTSCHYEWCKVQKKNNEKRGRGLNGTKLQWKRKQSDQHSSKLEILVWADEDGLWRQFCCLDSPFNELPQLLVLVLLDNTVKRMESAESVVQGATRPPKLQARIASIVHQASIMKPRSRQLALLALLDSTKIYLHRLCVKLVLLGRLLQLLQLRLVWIAWVELLQILPLFLLATIAVLGSIHLVAAARVLTALLW